MRGQRLNPTRRSAGRSQPEVGGDQDRVERFGQRRRFDASGRTLWSRRTPALVWKSARSEYAVDDAAMHRWYQQRVDAQTRPPIGPQRDWIEE